MLCAQLRTRQQPIIHILYIQKRLESSSVPKPPERASQSAPKITFRQFVGRALGAGLRNMAVALSPRGIKRAYQESPAVTSMSVIM